MATDNRVVLSSDHTAIQLRQASPLTSQSVVGRPSTSDRRRRRARTIPSMARRRRGSSASGDYRFGIILCGTGQGIMMAANKVKGIRCGVCADTFSARMIRQHNDANMLSIGARVVGEGLALDIVDAFLTAPFDGGRHAPRVEMIKALEK